LSVNVSQKKQFALGFILIILFLVVIEGGARAHEFFNAPCDFIDTEPMKKIDYFSLRQICSDFNLIAYENSAITLIAPNQNYPTININSDSFRGSEIQEIKSESHYRIFVIGGSTIFGAGSTSDETTIPALLQKRFNELEQDFDIEVVNAGIVSANSISEKFYIENYLLEFNPDLLIIYDGWNDSEDRILDEKLVIDEENNNKSFLKFQNFPYYRTPFVIYDILNSQNQEKTYPQENDDKTEQLISSWSSRWDTICKSGIENNYKTILTVQPIVGSGNKILTAEEKTFLSETKIHSEVINTINGMGDALSEIKSCNKTLDLRNVFENINEQVYVDRGHLSDFGNKIIADQLFNLSLPTVLDDLQNSSSGYLIQEKIRD